MIQIKSKSDFKDMLHAERAVVFVFFDWSNRAARSQRVFEEWEQQSAAQLAAANCMTYEIAPDGQSYSWKWINDGCKSCEEGEQTNGMVLWSCKGAVIGELQDAGAAGTNKLSQLTNHFFGLRADTTSSALEDEGAMFNIELLKILCCPETHQKLQLAAPPLLEKVNQQITLGQIRNRAGQILRDPLDAGLVRADGRCLYPLRQNIPVLLVDEAILLG